MAFKLDRFPMLKWTSPFTSQEAPTITPGHGPQRTRLNKAQPCPAITLSTSSTGVDVGARPPRGSRVAGPTLADEDGRPTTAATQARLKTQTTNVILFGEAGVGKSAVVNLIAQREIANVSSDVVGCTMRSTRYDVSFDETTFSIFDTVGLNQPAFGPDSHLAAIESAYRLILELKGAGGIHLLLLCMRGCRMTLTTRNNYRLFFEFLCQTKVPVALVVTGLEREVEMEDWWTRNKTGIERFGVRSDGHACITTVADGTPDEYLKYTESQQRIRELLKSCSLKTGAFLLDPIAWLAMTGMGMRRLVKEGNDPKRRDIEKVLSKRLRLHPDNVKKIMDMMEKGSTSTGSGED